MDEPDIVDDVNALLKMGVGDAYRLEHIKQSYIQNKTIWITDQRYLEDMKKKYLVKQSDIQEESGEKEKDSKDKEKIHCWKCGKKTSLSANFCMICGAPLYEVATDSEVEREEMPRRAIKKTGSGRWKIMIVILVPILILGLAGGAYSQGYFDNILEKKDSAKDRPARVADTRTTTSTDTGDSRCGKGTVFDAETNSCVLAGKASPKTETSTDTGDSRCGKGTVFDAETNSCVLDK